MIVLNFSHPLNAATLAALEAATGQEVAVVHDIPVALDDQASFSGQVEALLEAVSLSRESWQTESLVVNLPGLTPIAAVLLAQIHGRVGYFPTILRLARTPGVTPPTYAFAELIDLQAERERARARRGAGS